MGVRRNHRAIYLGEVCRHGLFRIIVSREQYGGLGLDFSTVIFLEELQRINSGGFAAAVWAHVYLAMTHLNAEGTEDQKQTYLIPVLMERK